MRLHLFFSLSVSSFTWLFCAFYLNYWENGFDAFRMLTVDLLTFFLLPLLIVLFSFLFSLAVHNFFLFRHFNMHIFILIFFYSFNSHTRSPPRLMSLFFSHSLFRSLTRSIYLFLFVCACDSCMQNKFFRISTTHIIFYAVSFLSLLRFLFR